MRVQVRDGEGEPVLVKFDPDGGLEALYAACALKLGFQPAAISVKGAKITDAGDLEEGDEVRCERESRKRPAEDEPDRENRSTQGERSDDAALDHGTSNQLEIVVKAADQTVSFRVKPTTKLAKVFKAFNERMGVAANTYRYHIDGDRVPEQVGRALG